MNYACSVEYFGTHFHGWQFQNNARSVQQVVEHALSCVANETISVTCSGRTDSGVHALNQVINFKSLSERTNRQWFLGVNANLPSDVCLNWIVPVSETFNARYSAKKRHYRYVIFENSNRSALYNNRAFWLRNQLNVSLMNEAALHLIGEHDFDAFRSSQCQANHARRFMESITVTRNNRFVYIDVIGNAFLHNMVRIIAGTLIEIGLGKQKTNWTSYLLKNKNRSLGAKTASAQGLYFIQPFYSKAFKLPAYSRYPEL